MTCQEIEAEQCENFELKEEIFMEHLLDNIGRLEEVYVESFDYIV
jgi:hypothetical protein